MSDLIDDLDLFLQAAEETPEDKARKQKLLPSQKAIGHGSWCLSMGPEGLNGNPMAWDIQVGYVFADMDFVALSAMDPEFTDEKRAEIDQEYELNMRFGRWYSEDAPQGVLESRPLSALIEISQSQAEEVRFFDFKLPLISMMTDWFNELIDSTIKEFEETMIHGMKQKICPKCNKGQLGALIHYTGTAIHLMAEKEVDGEPKIQLIKAMRDKVDTINHVHLICPTEDCDYSEHVDMNVVEVLSADHLGDED